jgi:hypothetical protein
MFNAPASEVRAGGAAPSAAETTQLLLLHRPPSPAPALSS